MKNNGFIYNATIFRVRINNSEEELSFFIRQIRKQRNDEFDGEIWGKNLTGRFTGKSDKDVYAQIEKGINEKYPNGCTIAAD